MIIGVQEDVAEELAKVKAEKQAADDLLKHVTDEMHKAEAAKDAAEDAARAANSEVNQATTSSASSSSNSPPPVVSVVRTFVHLYHSIYFRLFPLTSLRVGFSFS